MSSLIIYDFVFDVPQTDSSGPLKNYSFVVCLLDRTQSVKLSPVIWYCVFFSFIGVTAACRGFVMGHQCHHVVFSLKDLYLVVSLLCQLWSATRHATTTPLEFTANDRSCRNDISELCVILSMISMIVNWCQLVSGKGFAEIVSCHKNLSSKQIIPLIKF